jgi:hypothetical protein
MAIPREYATSNPLVRDELSRRPKPVGTHVGDFVAPDYPVDAEIVDNVQSADHALNLDDLRAPGAEAKVVQFETGTTSTIRLVERAQKSTLDARKIEEAGSRGVDILADRAMLHEQDIMDAKEYRTAQLVFAAANFSGAHKDVTGLNFRTIDIYAKVQTWQEQIITDGQFPANRALIGRDAWNYARQNAEFNKFVAGPSIKGGSRDLTLERFAEYLGLEEVRIADFRRRLGSVGASLTQFWARDQFLLFCNQSTLSDRTFAQTPVATYGPEFGNAGGQTGAKVDVRTAIRHGIEGLMEVGAFHRYIVSLFNANLGFLATGIVGS